MRACLDGYPDDMKVEVQRDVQVVARTYGNASSESGGSAQSGGMAVEIARLRRKRFENIGAVDAPQVEHSVRPRRLVLLQFIDGCSSYGGTCQRCQSQCDRSIHGVFPLSCLLIIFVHMHYAPRATDLRCA
jgi:hypothetical protein